MQFEALTANLTPHTVMLCSFICIRMLHREIYNPRICLHGVYDGWQENVTSFSIAK